MRSKGTCMCQCTCWGGSGGMPSRQIFFILGLLRLIPDAICETNVV